VHVQIKFLNRVCRFLLFAFRCPLSRFLVLHRRASDFERSVSMQSIDSSLALHGSVTRPSL
jgi:hypothetical protein